MTTSRTHNAASDATNSTRRRHVTLGGFADLTPDASRAASDTRASPADSRPVSSRHTSSIANKTL
jgi:hypothetical protein